MSRVGAVSRVQRNPLDFAMGCAPPVRAALMLLLPFAAMRTVDAQAVRRGESTVRVTTPASTITGLLLYDSPQSLVISEPRIDRTIPRSEVTRLEVRGTKAGKGAKILGITGLAVGGLFGLAMNYGMCDYGNCHATAVPVTIAGGVIFGGIGAVGGAIIGSTFEKWTPVDPETLRSLPSRR